MKNDTCLSLTLIKTFIFIELDKPNHPLSKTLQSKTLHMDSDTSQSNSVPCAPLTRRRVLWVGRGTLLVYLLLLLLLLITKLIVVSLGVEVDYRCAIKRTFWQGTLFFYPWSAVFHHLHLIMMIQDLAGRLLWRLLRIGMVVAEADGKPTALL